MKKGFLIPLIVLVTLALASLACINITVYDGPPPAKPQVSAAQLEADRVSGEYFAGAIAMGALIVWSGLSMLGKLGRMRRGAGIYQAIYWLWLLGGVVSFAYGVLTPAAAFFVVLGAGLLVASIPWGFWGDRAF